MEELRIAFLVIGSVFIVGVLVHGIWKMRHQDSVPERSEPVLKPNRQTNANSDPEGFDEFGIGSVRVIKGTNDPRAEGDVHDESLDSLSSRDHSLSFTDKNQTSDSTDNSSYTSTEWDELVSKETPLEPVPESQPERIPEPPMYASVITQPKPHMNEPNQGRSVTPSPEDIPAPPEFLLKDAQGAEDTEGHVKTTIETPDFGLEITSGVPHDVNEGEREESKKIAKKRSSIRKRKEPTLGKDQMRIDFDDSIVEDTNLHSESHANNATADNSLKQSAEQNPKASSQNNATEVLVINVRASEDSPLSGAALLPLLLTLGFKFGDQDIFHRHVNANGKGPILFSLANMIKPGVFDIDNLETFSTLGISLFMVLPLEGEPHQVFNMMHNAARKIADEFDAQLLDGRRSILTKQGIQQYVEKIREFERQRIISNTSR